MKVIVASDNPFLELSHDLINIDTKDIADSVVCETVKRIKSIGEEQYTRYQEDRLSKQLKSIDDTKSRNKLPLFSYKQQLKSKKTTEVATVHNNVKLFSQLYITNQRREHCCSTVIIKRWEASFREQSWFVWLFGRSR